MGTSLYNLLDQSTYICDLVSSSNDDEECPGAGTYYFSNSFTMSDYMDTYSSILNYLGIALYAYDGDGDEVGCWKTSIKLSTSSSSSSSSSYSSTFKASVAFAGVLMLGFLVRRKRKEKVIDIGDNFELMS